MASSGWMHGLVKSVPSGDSVLVIGKTANAVRTGGLMFCFARPVNSHRFVVSRTEARAVGNTGDRWRRARSYPIESTSCVASTCRIARVASSVCCIFVASVWSVTRHAKKPVEHFEGTVSRRSIARLLLPIGAPLMLCIPV